MEDNIEEIKTAAIIHDIVHDIGKLFYYKQYCDLLISVAKRRRNLSFCLTLFGYIKYFKIINKNNIFNNFFLFL